MVCLNAKKKHCRGGRTDMRIDSYVSPTQHLDSENREYAHTVEGAIAGKYTGDAGEVFELGTGLKPLQYKDNAEKIADFVTHPEDMPEKVGQGLVNIATKNHYVKAGKDVVNVMKDPGDAKKWGQVAMNIPAVNLGYATGRFLAHNLRGFGGHNVTELHTRRAAIAAQQRAAAFEQLKRMYGEKDARMIMQRQAAAAA